jgi:hypothetical protein
MWGRGGIWSLRVRALLSPWRPISESRADKVLAKEDYASAGRWLKGAGDFSGRGRRLDSAESLRCAGRGVGPDACSSSETIRTGTNWSYDEAKRGVGYLGERIQ